jgi:hypothetical protein
MDRKIEFLVNQSFLLGILQSIVDSQVCWETLGFLAGYPVGKLASG